MRFDMRAPSWGEASSAELFAAALDMASWGEEQGCAQLVVCEHHASSDGYLPAPLVLASAMAGRTRTTPIQVAALIVPLHDPVELAEQMAVLDLVSGGRVTYVTAVGYRPEEYAMFGQSLKGRGRRMEACIEALRTAWTGEPFAYEGREVRVTPRPLRDGGPTLFMGGNSAVAARRAARLGMGMIAQGDNPSLLEVYQAECRALGNEPGLCIVPPAGIVTSAFVAEDPDRAWSELGPYLLHDAQIYASWLGASNPSATKSLARDVDELRAQQGAYQILTPEEAIANAKQFGLLLTQPLCGGIPPRLAWPSLELIAAKVLPALR
jgi:alkanesulfonate monooxygenase SsuD/methylene tetrahydromethanopterin reductase-like flavin-dependent oxidoreductase (luciferase family)